MKASSILIGFLMASSLQLAAREPNESRPDPIDRVSQYDLVHQSGSSEIPLKLHPKPVITWSNAVFGSADGHLFLWTEKDRPVVALRTYVNRQGITFENFRSFCDGPILARRFGGGPVVWSPLRGAEPMSVVPGVSRVMPSATSRLVQMRQIHRRFQVRANLVNAGGEHLLRPLPTPLYRYSNAQVIDGAVFGFVHGTAPGVLILIEAREDEGVAKWNYAVAAISVFSIKVTYNDKPVWSEDRRTAPDTSMTDLFDSQQLSSADLQ